MPGDEYRDLPGRRVLVVDDDRDAADSLSKLLGLLGHRVATAYDGPGGLEAALASWPDVAVLDLGMPGMDGLELARRLRARPRGEEVVLIALTGWAGAEFAVARERPASIISSPSRCRSIIWSAPWGPRWL